MRPLTIMWFLPYHTICIEYFACRNLQPPRANAPVWENGIEDKVLTIALNSDLPSAYIAFSLTEGKWIYTIGSFGLDPGKSFVVSDARVSPIGELLDILAYSWPLMWQPSCSARVMQRLIESVVWGSGSASTLMRPRDGFWKSMGCFVKIAPSSV